MYDVVTITVNYKMKDDIIKMLDGLKKDIAGSNLKVLPVVVDNDSKDGIGGYIRENLPDVEFIDAGGNVGFGKANNLALKRFEAKYYFILNPDVIFKDNEKTIKSLYDWMESHPKVGMIGPKLLNFDGTLQHSCYRFSEFITQPMGRLGLQNKWEWLKKLYDKFQMIDFDHNTTRGVDWIMGSAMFARSVAYQEVGGFDDRFFMYFEDCDWCRRFWDAGWPVYYVHDIVLMHGHRRASLNRSTSLRDIFKSITSNKITRIHLKSWLQYFWKWRGSIKP